MPTKAAFSDFGCEQWSKPVPPVANGFVADINASLEQEIFDMTQREWEANGHHDCEADDLGGCFEISKWVLHAPRL